MCNTRNQAIHFSYQRVALNSLVKQIRSLLKKNILTCLLAPPPPIYYMNYSMGEGGGSFEGKR